MITPMVHKALSPARFLLFGKPAIAPIIAALTILIGTPAAGAQTIDTVAGNGVMGYSGDGMAATASALNQPRGGAFDASGSMYIADRSNHRIRRISAAGTISTFAGTGVAGYSGDGGPATAAMLNQPGGVAFDTAGNLIIADSQNRRIRKVNSSSGIITTIAGTGTEGYSGDGGPATSAMLHRAVDLAIDTFGNFYFADSVDNRIRKISTAGIITTVAGTGVAGYSGDGGPATSAMLDVPVGVAVDSAGNLYIADAGNHRIRKVRPNDGFIFTVAGNGTGAGTDRGSYSGDNGIATQAGLNTPEGVAVDPAGNFYIADMANYRVRKVTASNNVITTIAGTGNDGFSGDGGLATQATLNLPWSVALDASGNVFVGDLLNNRVRKITFFATPGVTQVSFTLPTGGAHSTISVGPSNTARAGYAVLSINSGSAPYGTAVFSYTQNGVIVSEVGVPSSPPTTSARFFVEFRSGVPAAAGTIDVYTGFAAVNRGTAQANAALRLTNAAGATIANGTLRLAKDAHVAKYLNQLEPDFVLPANFASVGFGVLEITSDQPLSILALRLTTNQRNELLLTSTPIADMTKPAASTPIAFPQIADGGGYQTALLFLNTSNTTETGNIRFNDDNGAALGVKIAGGASGATFGYNIPPGGYLRMVTDGSPADVHRGWAQLTPDAGTSTPAGAGVFSYTIGGTLVTESGVPAATPTTHARIYIDKSGGHDTGLAVATADAAGASVILNAFHTDGITPAGSGAGTLTLAGKGHDAKFVGQIISGLPDGFTGVLDLTSTKPFVALTLRSLTNGRGDFLLTTFPIADVNQAPPSPVVFPQIADGGGYQTQFILLSTNAGASTYTLTFLDDAGLPIGIGQGAPNVPER